MSDYQRLVSYIYSYPGGTRDKNVGFAKAEVRNGQFKLNVSLKGVYTDTPETFGVHLLIEDKENKAGGVVLLPVGNVIVNSGAGQYADLLNPSNISGSGYQFEDISGVAVARQDNDYYRMFSLWKDMQIKPELVKFLPKDYRKHEMSEHDRGAEETVRSGENGPDERIEAVKNVVENEGNVRDEKIISAEKNEQSVSEPAIEQMRNGLKTDEEQTVAAAESVSASGVVLQADSKASDMESLSQYENVPVSQPSNANNVKPQRPVTGEMGGIFDNSDFIDVFGDDYYYDCVEVTPEQLQRLPIEDKAVVSNSFLEHGYYNFKHLLFGKVRENERHTKYFIGVPGMYCNRERFMATMFGYGNFKRSHRADCSNPYFGYWYQEF